MRYTLMLSCDKVLKQNAYKIRENHVIRRRILIFMKKRLAILLTFVLMLTLFTGCGTKKEDADVLGNPVSDDLSKEDPDAKEDGDSGKIFKIGICQLVQHDALDAAYKGFVDGLKEAGYEDGKNISIDYKNANGEQANCNTIATKFVNDKDDLILAIATSAAQACVNATTNIPILVTAVTDPAQAALVNSNEAPGGNVTGTSDLTPVADQIQLLKELMPDAKKIAILYCSSEDNSTIQAEMAKKEAESLGLETIEATVSNSNEIQQVVQNLVGKVDAIYAPTDNTIAAGMETVSLVATPNKIPIICGEDGMVKSGGLATKGINYYNLGKQTAAQAVKILEGADPSTMPIEYLQDVEFTYNEEIANELGIEIPEELKK